MRRFAICQARSAKPHTYLLAVDRVASDAQYSRDDPYGMRCLVSRRTLSRFTFFMLLPLSSFVILSTVFAFT